MLLSFSYSCLLVFTLPVCSPGVVYLLLLPEERDELPPLLPDERELLPALLLDERELLLLLGETVVDRVLLPVLRVPVE